MKIATWNVNSIRARIPIVTAWLERVQPDVLLLQETKCLPEKFPAEPFEDLNYNIALIGEPSLNGVAILAKSPIEDVIDRLPGDPDDEEARYIEGTVDGVRVASVYVPNGTEVDSPRFDFKLAFFDRLRAHAEALLEDEQPLVIGGDYNVAPTPSDVYDAKELEGTICYHPAEREKWRTLTHIGLYDAYRAVEPETIAFSWWHYQARSFQLGNGLRIDHLLLSPGALDRLEAVEIDEQPRRQKTPSDHTPVLCSLAA
ncbi:MAG: exodeoxyribonuclease III [Geminicoccaceae bacterium]